MTSARMDFVPLDRSLFRRSLAESLSALLSQRYPTAKHVARAINIEPVTAENMRRGKLSVGTLEKALLAEGRDLWNRLGDELFGETFYEFEERRIADALREVEGAKSNLVRLRTQAAELLESAPSLDQAGLGAKAHQDRRGEPRSWNSAGGEGDLGTPRSRDRGGR